MQLKLLVLLVNQLSLGQKLVSLVPGVKINQTSRFPVGYRPRLSDLGLSLPQISTLEPRMQLKLLVLLVNQLSLGQKLVSLMPGVKIKQTSRFPVGYRPRLSVLWLSLPQISTFGAPNVAKTPGSLSKSTIPWLETCQPRARGENKTNFEVSSGLQAEIKRFGAQFAPNQHIWSLECS